MKGSLTVGMFLIMLLITMVGYGGAGWVDYSFTLLNNTGQNPMTFVLNNDSNPDGCIGIGSGTDSQPSLNYNKNFNFTLYIKGVGDCYDSGTSTYNIGILAGTPGANNGTPIGTVTVTGSNSGVINIALAVTYINPSLSGLFSIATSTGNNSAKITVSPTSTSASIPSCSKLPGVTVPCSP